MNWSKRLSKALDNYRKAVYDLAEVVEEGSTQYGRDRMVEITPLDEKKINWLNSLARLSYIDKDLLPEICVEVVGESKPKSWLDRAKREGLKASQLRKMLRQHHRMYKKDKAISSTAKWPKYSIMIASELRSLTPEQRATALARLQTILWNNPKT